MPTTKNRYRRPHRRELEAAVLDGDKRTSAEIAAPRTAPQWSSPSCRPTPPSNAPGRAERPVQQELDRSAAPQGRHLADDRVGCRSG